MYPAPPLSVTLFPRRKKDARGRNATQTIQRRRGASPLVFSRANVVELFDCSQHEAAAHLGVSTTSLKKICRQLGIVRWPYSKRKKVCPARDSDSNVSLSDTGSSCGSLHESRDEQDDRGALKKGTPARPAIDIATSEPGQNATAHKNSRLLAELLSGDYRRPGAAVECDSSSAAASTSLRAELFGTPVRTAGRISQLSQVPVKPDYWSRSLEGDAYYSDDQDNLDTHDDLSWLVPTKQRCYITKDMVHHFDIEMAFREQRGQHGRFAGPGLDIDYSCDWDVPYAIHWNEHN